MNEVHFPIGTLHAKSGVTVEYDRETDRLRISGWYDDYCGIPASHIGLEEFLTLLGVDPERVGKICDVKT